MLEKSSTGGALLPAGRSPVMADVAGLAGVSLQTVSRVVNGADHVRPATRKRVDEAISQLGYRPNVAARALVTQRSATVGVICTASEFRGPATIYRSVQSAARAAGYFVSAIDLPEFTCGDVTQAVEHLRDQRVEGIVLIAANDEALTAVRARSAGELPVVVVEGDLSRVRLTAGVDNRLGAAIATEHLIALGHTEIQHVAGPAGWAEARERLSGWRDAMQVAGLRPPEPLVGDWSAGSGHAAGVRLAAMAATGDVTAVFVANDHMAVGVLRALHEAGVRVPEDVSVVGFDDLPEAAYLIPPLTTVHQDLPAVGERAIEVLRAAVEHGGPAGSRGLTDRVGTLLRPTLVVRRSTCPPRATPSITIHVERTP
ncbi:DNA-binding transcriptional regulator, LacI/PurR family [Nocardioides scoriae]|uniref:DNA-binding transcriptional regulator, LacI/PurR family n=1 Tax=Nocardioides scoriae TaxID=642780 RepID=A0A1H1UBD5_9ACTN|nr:LacI family DNA-binding transcriptional regulator [Nocardioides scoriae]SDS69249.1 DNA-binding transcriptional regulator, LacI/PurR family [Nocardioides scoriae]